MEHQSAALSTSLSVDSTTTAPEPEPHLDACNVLPNDAKTPEKKKKKKRKNRRKSLEKNEVDLIQDELIMKQLEREETGEEKVEEAVAEVDGVTKTVTAKEDEQETVVIKEDNQQEEATLNEASEPLSIEPTSFLDTTRKNSGAWAVGSLLSRFKVGRKKSIPSGNEPATKLELRNNTPLETDGKQVEVVAKKSVDTSLMELKRDCGEDGGQSGEKDADTRDDKHNVMEKQKKTDKGIVQTGSSSVESIGEVQTQPEAEESEVTEAVQLSLTDTMMLDDQENVKNIGADTNVDMLSECIMENTSEIDEAAVPILVGESGSAVVAMETLKHDSSIALKANSLTDEETITAETQDENVLASADIPANDLIAGNQCGANVATIDTVSRKLDFDYDTGTDQSIDTTQVQSEVKVIADVRSKLNEAPVKTFVTEINEAVGPDVSSDNDESKAVAVEPLAAILDDDAALNKTAQNETVLSVPDETNVKLSVAEPVAIAGYNEGLQSETAVTSKTELLAAKVAPPTSDLAGNDTAQAKLAKMSPVKSLASRFEGKHEQSLDSLKFRTVREFFSEERSIRVGAEKEKYEAQAQQQKLKAKAEEEAKAKYKTGSGFRSSEKEAVCDTSSLELTKGALVLHDSVVSSDQQRVDSVGFATPDSTTSRKKISFDAGYAVTDSPSKLSDDAPKSLTPVKSIASRFEGKHEQSLDDLKFRTVREFFPHEEKRSIHVGDEKAKFEALRKQQEEATKTAEHVKSRSTAVLPGMTTVVKYESSMEASTVDASVKTSSSTRGDACNDEMTNAMLCSSEMEKSAVVESTDDSVVCVAVEGLSVNGKEASVNKLPKANSILPSTGPIAPSVTVTKTDDCAVVDDQCHAEGVMDAAVSKLVSVDMVDFEASMDDGTEFDQETDKAVSLIGTRVVDLDLEDANGRTGVDITEDCLAYEDACVNLELEQSAKHENVQDIELKIDMKLDKRSVEETIVNRPAEPIDGVIEEGDIGDQLDVSQALDSQNLVQVAEHKAANSELVELDLGRAVDGNQVDSVVSSGCEVISRTVDSESVGILQPTNTIETSSGSQDEAPGSALSAENGFTEVDLEKSAVDVLKEQIDYETEKTCEPMLAATERFCVTEDDHTIEPVETLAVDERRMIDGDDVVGFLSKTKDGQVLESKSENMSSKSSTTLSTKTSAKASPKATGTVSAVSASGHAKLTPANPIVSASAKRALSTASTTASHMAKKTLEANELQKVSPPQKRSVSDSKGIVGETALVKPPSAAATGSVPVKRGSTISSTTPRQSKCVLDHARDVSKSRPALTTHGSKCKGAMDSTDHVRPSLRPTVPVTPIRASIMTPSTSFLAKKAAEHVENDTGVVVPAVAVRNKKYLNVKSKVLAQMKSGPMQPVTCKTITKEDFIAAERRKSLGSAGARSLLGATTRRASLAARATINGPPEPFVRSALSRQRLSSTPPRYMNYENTPGYAERARQQYERRKRLEEENAAKSEMRQRELRTFFAGKQHKSLMSSTQDARGDLEVNKCRKAAKDSGTVGGKKALRSEKQRARLTRSYRQSPSATSSAGTSSSNGVPSLTSKLSSVSSAAEKVVTASVLKATVMGTGEVIDCAVATDAVTSCAFATDETVVLTPDETASST